MLMRKVEIDEVPIRSEGATEIERRPLTDHLDTSDIAINYYRLQPGETFVGGLHTHLDQEEIFIVMAGKATFETKSDPSAEPKSIEVGAGGVIRFGRGDYHRGRNESNEVLEAIALGAPKNSVEGRVPNNCSRCGESDYLETVMIDGELKAECPKCGSVFNSGLH